VSIRNIHHVGCVVEHLDTGLRFWHDTVGFPLVDEGENDELGIRGALLSTGNAFIELIAPVRQGTEFSEFLQRRGPGLHHIAFETEDVAAEHTAIRARGVPLRSDGIREGLTGARFFVEPVATQNVLVEVVQPKHPTTPGGRLEGATFTELKMVATLTNNLFRAASQWERNFGLLVESYLVHPEADNRHVVISASGQGPVYIEVIKPLSEGGKNNAYLQKMGDTLFQLVMRTDDLDAAVKRFEDGGYRIQQEVGMSLGQEPATFLHPKSTGGIFITFSAMPFARSGPTPKEAFELRVKDEWLAKLPAKYLASPDAAGEKQGKKGKGKGKAKGKKAGTKGKKK
jgi:methylmalonyl-CoA/ethylmalonyl-CoA epimerase